jgi:hypothetical protein
MEGEYQEGSRITVIAPRQTKENSMAYLDFGEQKHYLKRIKSTLKRRGLVMDPEDEWEKHGPHLPEMKYRVFIGRAYEELDPSIACICAEDDDCPKHRDGFYVVIYPKAVYSIDDPDDWWKIEEENKIVVVDI